MRLHPKNPIWAYKWVSGSTLSSKWESETEGAPAREEGGSPRRHKGYGESVNSQRMPSTSEPIRESEREKQAGLTVS